MMGTLDASRNPVGSAPCAARVMPEAIGAPSSVEPVDVVSVEEGSSKTLGNSEGIGAGAGAVVLVTIDWSARGISEVPPFAASHALTAR
jgi:hypothetical protein